ncbi:E3 ubiquitin-protein ligase RNF139-like [Asterias amurensis]|uniref:E3 ubiquitin-protein ligase RNF139-like n=1 Tax=Asterias amurensis TaxID=7602 RepID=UPI003AB1D485
MLELWCSVQQYPYDIMMFTMSKKVQAVLSVVLRVPSLFIIDAVVNLRVDTGQFMIEYPVWSGFLAVMVVSIAAAMFCLSTRTLLKIYTILVCIGTLGSTLWWNNVMMEKVNRDKCPSKWDLLLQEESICEESSKVSPVQIVLSGDFALYAVVQMAYAFTYVACITLLPERFTLNIWLVVCAYFVSPVFIRLGMTYFSSDNPSFNTLIAVNAISVLVPALEVATIFVSNIIWSIWNVPMWYRTYRFMLQNFGFNTVLENAWIQFQVPNVLRTFWLLRFTVHIIQIVPALRSNEVLPVIMSSNVLTNESQLTETTLAWNTFLEVTTHGCDSTLAVLGLTAVVSYLSYHLGKWADKFMGGESDEVAHIGTVTAILFFILSLQTGLPGLEPTKRLVRLFRNFILLSTAMLHFIHNMLSQVMMTLSTSHTASIWKHLRALSMSAILILIPISVISYLWTSLTMGTWLLAVTAFCMELIIKVTVTLIIYTLFLIDTYSDKFWESLDDYVYYIKATGSTIEFLFGIFLFGNGVWILIFESGGVIRAIMIVIHAYFNIFQLGKNGWKKFQNRRMAVKKIDNLPIATEHQLKEHNDVCAICYQELISARITPCEHLFHALCLRKWLYVQDTCPLCHKEIMQNIKSEQEEGDNEEVNDILHED